MAVDFDHKSIEKKWRDFWDQHRTFEVKEDESFPKNKRMYILDMFPYPSGSGLHVGHPEGYTATDIMTRYYKMNGFNVLHPMGFDSFGLPAENYAIQTGTHPAETTKKNINYFRQQIKAIGFAYDWSREVATSDLDYYRWTQWIFLKLFEKGLAYESEMPINWCPDCRTGLANEEVKDGKCDRCGAEIERKRIRQWMLKITAYADRLLEDLNLLDWQDSIKLMQKNWIGKSYGAEVDFRIDGFEDTVTVFTTRPDTLFGATYMVLAPEHPLVEKITDDQQKQAVEQYIHEAAHKTDLQRTELNKKKTGVFTGTYAVNPVNGEKIPVWIADYVLLDYGTGAIMAVPGHDDRDFDFAKAFSLPVIQVVSRDGSLYDLKEADPNPGIAVNSGKYTGIKTEDVKKKIIEDLESEGKGKGMVNYKLRDWVFSRQRYWGEPIPVVHCEKCGIVPLKEEDLPLKLPEVESYKPSGNGESPLASIEDWVRTTCPECGGPAKRETNTMPQWAGSCWYYIRYTDPANNEVPASNEAINYWLPVSLYVGGAEHAVLHLLYARFWHKFLYDIGVVNSPEPFMKLRNQGMILGENGEKMSKSRGNVINPDDVIEEYGADTLRMYEMFMGPLASDKPWSTSGILGIKRFLDKVWKLTDKAGDEQTGTDQELLKVYHRTVMLVGRRIENMEFNTAISQLMILVNTMSKRKKLNTALLKDFVRILYPFAPFISEELWEMLGEEPSVIHQKWPEYDEEMTKEEMLTIVVQINGKLRADFQAEPGTVAKEMKEKALSLEKIQSWIKNKEIKKVIAVPDKLVNIVVK